MKLHQLFERASSKVSTAFNLTRKVKKTLSNPAMAALTGWLSYNWTLGSLSIDFKNGRSGTFKEIYDAFEPVRQELRRVYGDTVTLYRGMRTENIGGSETGSNRLYSWTFDEQIAREYAFLNGADAVATPLTQEQIDTLVSEYERKGLIRYRDKYLKRDSADPDYYNMYDRDRHHITSGESDELRAYIEDNEREISEYESTRDQRGIVAKAEIPVNDIVWFSTTSEKEVIVIGHAK